MSSCKILVLSAACFGALLGVRAQQVNVRDPELGEFQDDGKCFPLKQPWFVAFRNYEVDPFFGLAAKCVRFSPTDVPYVDNATHVKVEYGDHDSLDLSVQLVRTDGITTKMPSECHQQEEHRSSLTCPLITSTAALARSSDTRTQEGLRAVCSSLPSTSRSPRTPVTSSIDCCVAPLKFPSTTKVARSITDHPGRTYIMSPSLCTYQIFLSGLSECIYKCIICANITSFLSEDHCSKCIVYIIM
uniref:Putative lipocalin 21 n=1 Tax=Rhipicephalus microplus TaxID=6941 RepID=A0A6G5A940_RHIMP